MLAADGSKPNPPVYLPAHFLADADLPWIAASTQKSAKPLRFFSADRGFVELLRMEPGAVMPLHRHTGEVHAFNISGRRQLCTGEIIGPGEYVFEPAGNVDWWKIVGDEPMVALVIVMGTVEFLGPGNTVKQRVSSATQLSAYLAWCNEHDVAPRNLLD